VTAGWALWDHATSRGGQCQETRAFWSELLRLSGRYSAEPEAEALPPRGDHAGWVFRQRTIRKPHLLQLRAQIWPGGSPAMLEAPGGACSISAPQDASLVSTGFECRSVISKKRGQRNFGAAPMATFFRFRPINAITTASLEVCGPWRWARFRCRALPPQPLSKPEQAPKAVEAGWIGRTLRWAINWASWG